MVFKQVALFFSGDSKSVRKKSEKMPSIRTIKLGTALEQKVSTQSKFSIRMKRETRRDKSQTQIGDTLKIS